jgi:hypothetical protein
VHRKGSLVAVSPADQSSLPCIGYARARAARLKRDAVATTKLPTSHGGTSHVVFCNSLDGRRPANLQTALVPW